MPVKNTLTLLLATLLFLSVSALGSNVLMVTANQQTIAISHNEQADWVQGDEACVVSHKKEIACGEVIKTSKKGAIVRVSRRNGQLGHSGVLRSAVETILRPAAALPATCVSVTATARADPARH